MITRSMILWYLSALLVVTCGVIQAEGEATECLNVPAEKMAKLRDLVVKEDVHDKLIGNYTLLWVSKEFVDQGENRCDMYTSTKVDGKVGLLRVILSRYDRTLNFMEKVENGIYLMKKREDHKTMGKFHIVYADNGALAFVFCLLTPWPEGDESKTGLWTGLNIRTMDLRTEPDPDTQTAVERALTRVQEHQDTLGEIVYKPLVC